MKKLLFVFTLTILTIGMAWAQTTINFDDASKWTQGSGSITSYQTDHSYNDGSFSATGGPALRQGTTVQDGYAGALGTYSWRLRDVSTVSWIITISSGGVSNFNVDIRRWDGSPSPDYNLDYSTDGGTSWTTVTTINNSALDNSSNWKTFSGTINNANNNIKIRLKANGTTERIMVDNFVWTGYSGGTPTVATPNISPSTGNFYSPFNATISCTTEGATIYYTTDGSDPDDTVTEYTEPIYIEDTTTLKAIAYAEGYDTSSIATAVYTFPEITEVANIATLRNQPVGSNVYRLTGEAILTFQQNLSYHPKWVQDATAAIYIYDTAGKITTAYNMGDGITGLIGTLSTYNSLLEFVPVADPGPATSTGNPVVPEERTLASLTSADQSKLIKVYNVTLGATGNFTTGAQSIPVTQGETTLTLRTLTSTDYNGQPIPQTPQNITCLVGQYNADIQISPRFLADFEEAFDIPEGSSVTIGSDIVEITGGNANIVTGDIPPVNNGTFVASNSFILELFGAGPWQIEIQTTALWGAYYSQGAWHSVAADIDGIIGFEVPSAKGVQVPIVLGDQDPTLPVELSSFTAVLTSDMYVLIKWIAESETNHSGYNILRAEKKDLATAQRINAQIVDKGVETGTQISYSYTDFEAYTNMVYYYWLESVSLDGISSYYGPLTVTIGDPTQEPRPPEVSMVTKLLNAYPNPFNPNTNIRYSIKDPGKVRIDIYNLKGQLIQTLTAEHNTPGFYQIAWNGCDANGKPVASGIYMYRMTSGNYSSVKKMVLAK